MNYYTAIYSPAYSKLRLTAEELVLAPSAELARIFYLDNEERYATIHEVRIADEGEVAHFLKRLAGYP